MINPCLKIVILGALVADSISQLFNLARILLYVALLAAIGFTAHRDDYAHHGELQLALVASVVLTVKLARWVREEF